MNSASVCRLDFRVFRQRPVATTQIMKTKQTNFSRVESIGQSSKMPNSHQYVISYLAADQFECVYAVRSQHSSSNIN